MKKIAKDYFVHIVTIIGVACLLVCIFVGLASSKTGAVSNSSNGQRLITIHDNGTDKGILTYAKTLREAFKESKIIFDENDTVEPGLDEELVASSYDVNIYRARPITIVDGPVRERILTSHRTAKQIAKHANIELQDEDIAEISSSVDIVGQGNGLQMVIDRATPFNLVLYGSKTLAYTQQETVEEMMKEKGISINEGDTLSVDKSKKITENMTVEIWRNGKQTITEKQSISFDIERIQDADREIGYKKIATPGEKGEKSVIYEVIMKNGKEVSRKEIQSVVLVKPKKQVEIVGAKPDFEGDFAAALAKLRSCEGNYNSWNPAGPYYGAYQFDQGTWNSVSNAPYGSATPAEQDAAAHALYLRRGWQPWPVCGASLPDIYR